MQTKDPEDIAAKFLPFKSQQISVPCRNGRSFHLRFLDEGPDEVSGGPILCVHGNPTWSFYYRSVVRRFSPTRRVIAVDHLGCGRSDKPSEHDFEYCLASHRDNLLALIRELDLQNVTLLAHDWGGAIGLTALLKEPGRFEKIVLLNTAAFPPPYIPGRIAACRWPWVGPVAVRGANAFARAAQFMTTARSPLSKEAKQGMIAPYDTWANRVAINAFVRDIPMKSTHPTYALLQELENQLPTLKGFPILLIWGMQDWCFRPECLTRLQQTWPHAKTQAIEDAGHYVLEDAQEETLRAMESFLTERSGSNV